MRKVIEINLNNNAYQVDEGGYEALSRYLQDAERSLGSNLDRAEILADIEQAIADKCRATLGPHKNVVSSAEIERILVEMGPVSDRADSSADRSSPNAGDRGSLASRPRRLYRIREGQMIWGVCTGLAAYAGVDVTWVRAAFVLMFLIGGLGLIAYMAMVFIVPVAKTSEERAAAHGHPFSARELVDRIRRT